MSWVQIYPVADCCREIARSLNNTLFLFTSYSPYSILFIHHTAITSKMNLAIGWSVIILTRWFCSEWEFFLTVRAAKRSTLFFFVKEFSLKPLVHWGLSAFFRSAHCACFPSPFCPLLSSSCQDVEHMLSHRLWSPWPWRGTKGFSGVTSSSPCGLPQPAPSSAQHAELLSLPHLLPER